MLLRRRGTTRPGGIETHGSRLAAGLRHSFTVESTAWTGPLWASPFYAPLYRTRTRKSSSCLVHCEDGVTALISHLADAGRGKAVVTTLHGTDLIFPLKWYQRKLAVALKSMAALVCVSRATAYEAVRRGGDLRRIEIIPNAAEKVRGAIRQQEARRLIEDHTGIPLQGKKVLFSLGRPVRRKGFDHFIESVFPHLPRNTVYIIAGPPLPRPFWASSLARLVGHELSELAMVALGSDSVYERLRKLSDRPNVYLLNDVNDSMRNLLFFASDLFVMPNRHIPGDMEGFGIVGIEAAARGIPVVATGIEGIPDAIHEGKNGILAPERNPAAMTRIIRGLLQNDEYRKRLGRSAREFTAKVFAPERIAARYTSLFSRIIHRNRNPDFPLVSRF